MLDDIIQSRQSPWTTGTGPQNDIVLSSRIRLARNFATLPFPLKQTEESAMAVWSLLQQYVEQHPAYQFYDLPQASPLARQVLVEKHLISPEHARADHYQAVVISDDELVSIMVNEEDHLRIQCFAPGLDLIGLWEKAAQIDDEIDKLSDFAFDERLGYLTCCPTNLGNGLRGSVMLHLPGLRLTKQLGLLNQLSNLGMTVRGLYGEGSEASGDLYQISNQVTLGQEEKDILTNLHAIAQQIIKEERKARTWLKEHASAQLEDVTWRALGTLTHAKRLASKEALELLSQLRLGHSLGFLPDFDYQRIDALYLWTQPGYLQLQWGSPLAVAERDKKRAEAIQQALGQEQK